MALARAWLPALFSPLCGSQCMDRHEELLPPFRGILADMNVTVLHSRITLCLVTMSLLFFVLACSGCRMPWQRTIRTWPSDRSTGAIAVSCPLDGVSTTQDYLLHRPLAVMIENSPNARPQSGLTQACVVYEAVTEGGITRFLAVYLHGASEVLGPVRSARPHFINLMREYQAAYVHCGESNEALQILQRDPAIYNIDQMRFGKSFWRDRRRIAPHNLYTSTRRIRQLLFRYGWDVPVSPLPSFAGSVTFTGGQPATKVVLHFGGAVHYRLTLVYDARRGGYLRYMDGMLHIDRETNQPIVARNVLIQRVYALPYSDSTKGTFDVGVIGSGDGLFLRDGKQTAMLWMKSTAGAITTFTDLNNRPLPFQAGQTWVELLPQQGSIEFPDIRKTVMPR